MANSYFWDTLSKQPDLRQMFCKVAIGASGAPTLNASLSRGIQTISRSSTGVYVITLNAQYDALVGFNGSIIDDTANGLLDIQITGEDVAGDKTITIKCFGATAADNTAFTAKDPTNGAVLLLSFVLQHL